MNNVIKKTILLTSMVGVVAILAGCSGMCGHKQYGDKKHHKPHQYQPPVEAIVVYQTYDAADVERVSAKMYTRSSRGGESKMGHIKFHETDKGLKMAVDLKDMRPGVLYTLKIHQCGSCNNNSTCCDNSAMAIDLPRLETGLSGKLNETFIVRGLTAAQLKNAKIYMERDGGYKAAWGTLEQSHMF